LQVYMDMLTHVSNDSPLIPRWLRCSLNDLVDESLCLCLAVS
jgi:hypothetical protein